MLFSESCVLSFPGPQILDHTPPFVGTVLTLLDPPRARGEKSTSSRFLFDLSDAWPDPTWPSGCLGPQTSLLFSPSQERNSYVLYLLASGSCCDFNEDRRWDHGNAFCWLGFLRRNICTCPKGCKTIVYGNLGLAGKKSSGICPLPAWCRRDNMAVLGPYI